MGLFGRLFGRKEPEKPKSYYEPEPPNPELPWRTEIHGEMRFDEGGITEVDKPPRAVICHQGRYGKILQYPDGPIVSGSEHGTTGMSKGFPEGSMLGSHEIFGTSGYYLWRNYPWEKEGGEIKKIIIRREGKQYVVCARRMIRPEEGEEKKHIGRGYTEMHAILIPAEQWTVGMIPQIADILEAKGVVERNKNMEPVVLNTDILDKPLPEGWLDSYVKDLIIYIASGRPLAIEDLDISEKEFLQKLFYCLICFPEVIARRVSFGAGLSELKVDSTEKTDNDVRVALANTSTCYVKEIYRPTKIKGKWEGVEPEDLARGQRYLTEVVKVIGDCKTPRQVMKAIKENMPSSVKNDLYNGMGFRLG